ncbi:HNH endonuclease [Mycolicibacterium fluoranthenivorans]|uniref:HNH endonuclease n=1 Tax=Mycolicibacterium fluoranthenivorans TaxID=258505 RepID=A0A7G8PA30_9MYCO|nr:YDG/SRA domain-containing protein [Mycolicibacterium fluoranthenivorans]QNJ91196.1 HNH endonuclease [Mycolicibacterium fluoranthenivorans]
MAERFYGHIPGYPAETTFDSRAAASKAGVHRPLQAGICGGSDGAESIVVSGGYVDDQDFGDVIIYTGHGGQDPNSNRQIKDQELTVGNLGLVRSHLDGLPIRVVRGFEGNPAHSPASGYRYDGLYRVEEYWQDKGVEGYRIWRFRLVALDDTTAAEPAEVDDDPSAPAVPPGRVQTTIQRIIRSTKVAEKIKHLHDYTCQVCGVRLDTPAGPYAEAAHIRALGTPHHGPDVVENLLCLCPNDHVRFDTGAIYIDQTRQVRASNDDSLLGALALKPAHKLDPDHLAYHRVHFAGKLDGPALGCLEPRPLEEGDDHVAEPCR